MLLLLPLLLLLLHSRAGNAPTNGDIVESGNDDTRQDLELGQARVSHLGCGRRNVQCTSVET